ncbi:MAG: hypothetical protein QF570_03350 [Myxococcota bacterium]|nr:hypothetical protein [Myxococcota bacterium]
MTGNFHAQKHQSSLSSSCDIGGPGSGGGLLAPCTQGDPTKPDPRGDPPVAADQPAAMRDSADGSDLPFWPGIGVELQLTSPVVVELPLGINPRVFVNTELSAVFPPERTIATEGNLGVIREPQTSADTPAIPTQALQGAGSHTESLPQTFQYSAQVGIVIPLKAGGRTVNIKPSFGWSQWRLDVTGRVSAGIKDDVNGTESVLGSTPLDPFGTETREIYLKATDTLVVNGIGPGIEVEYVSGRFGDVAAAVFIGANAYKVLGDRKVELDDAVTKTGQGLLDDTYRGHWEHKIDPWFYRLRLGLRFHYMPN